MAASTQIPDNCPAWLAQWIGKNDERLANIEKSLIRLVKRRAYKENPESSTKGNQVTFKWLVEKLLVPAMFMAAGYFLGGGG